VKQGSLDIARLHAFSHTKHSWMPVMIVTFKTKITMHVNKHNVAQRKAQLWCFQVKLNVCDTSSLPNSLICHSNTVDLQVGWLWEMQGHYSWNWPLLMTLGIVDQFPSALPKRVCVCVSVVICSGDQHCHCPICSSSKLNNHSWQEMKTFKWNLFPTIS